MFKCDKKYLEIEIANWIGLMNKFKYYKFIYVKFYKLKNLFVFLKNTLFNQII